MSNKIKVEKMSDGSIRISGNGPEVTKDVAMVAHDFHKNSCEIFVGVRGGITRKIENWRRNGQTQTWKTRPSEFRVPVKYGLKSTDQLTQHEAGLLHAADACPLTGISDQTAKAWAETCRAGKEFAIHVPSTLLSEEESEAVARGNRTQS